MKARVYQIQSRVDKETLEAAKKAAKEQGVTISTIVSTQLQKGLKTA
jgi:antitoxin component of RelBE/YafQ-DinJ toxin-antitoxin module